MTRLFPLFIAALIGTATAQECNFASPGYYPNRFTDQGDGTVLDRATGLQWWRCDLGQSWDGQCTGFPERFTWQEALQAITRFNQEQAELGRPDDWRLPNIKELASLINFHCRAPAVFDTLWDSDQTAAHYWSATPELRKLGTGNVNQAWRINFFTGTPKAELITQRLQVRPVRGENAP